MIKVMHVITTLGPAGAETTLCRIVSKMDRSRFDNEIVSLTSILDLAEKMKEAGTQVRSLRMKKSVPNPLLVMRLARWIRASRPDVIHTWMYHANLVGALAARLAGDAPVVWAIHHNSIDPRVDKRRTLLVNRACALLSWKFPARIVFCSEASLRLHKKIGYAPRKLQVIPNGFDLEQVKPAASARASLREELCIPADALIIGMAARFHPHKDHRNFIQAAATISKQIPGIHFVLCGLNVTRENSQLAEWMDAAGLNGSCHLLGPREDMPRLFAGMDIATTSSRSEAFPVVIGEAMACGIPCVVTDAGDSAMIVGHTGIVVPPEDPNALARGWRNLIQAGPEVRHRLGMAARKRVQKNFALPAIVERYQAIYAELAVGKPHAIPASGLSECTSRSSLM